MKEDISDKTIYQYRGVDHREEKEGPAVINYFKNGPYAGFTDYYYSQKGILKRKNGPRSIVSFSDYIRVEFRDCKWINSSFCTHSIINLTREQIIDSSKAMAAPYHEWDSTTCGEGNCWQWDHNPQRYGLGHTKPPKCMFTQPLPEGFVWDWNHSMGDWHLTPLGLTYTDGYSLSYLKKHFKNGEFLFNLNYKLEF